MADNLYERLSSSGPQSDPAALWTSLMQQQQQQSTTPLWSGMGGDALIPPPRNPAAPAPWAANAVRGVAGKIADMVTLPGRAMQQGITTEEAIPWAADVGMGMVGAPGTPAGALGSSIKPIRAYHGSPHDFDRFDLSKIGTGEGAQAYGHGLYFAENPTVAKAYRDNLSGYDTISTAARQAIERAGGDRAAAARDMQDRYARLSANNWDPENAAWAKQVADILASDKPLGKMYEVNINAEPQQFLDWHKPLAQHGSPVVDQVKSAMGSDYYGKFDPVKAERAWGQFSNAPAGTAIKNGFIASDDALASSRLREAGIPGIKYLDQGSRGAGEGTNNYVVFNDKLIDILRKYGIAGGTAGGLTAAQQNGTDQNGPL